MYSFLRPPVFFLPSPIYCNSAWCTWCLKPPQIFSFSPHFLKHSWTQCYHPFSKRVFFQHRKQPEAISRDFLLRTKAGIYSSSLNTTCSSSPLSGATGRRKGKDHYEVWLVQRQVEREEDPAFQTREKILLPYPLLPSFLFLFLIALSFKRCGFFCSSLFFLTVKENKKVETIKKAMWKNPKVTSENGIRASCREKGSLNWLVGVAV